MQDEIIAIGKVNIKIYKNNLIINETNDNNLVLNLGKKNISRLLAGDVTGKKVSKIGVGTSFSPALVTDTNLTNPFVKDIINVTFPTLLSVQFNFEINNDEANNMTIRELALLTSDNILFARKVRSAEIVKTSAIRLVGSWTITIN